MNLSTFLARFPEVQTEGPGDFLVPCPAHADGHPSLLVGQSPTGIVTMFCRAGCSKAAVLDAMGLTLADVHGDGTPDPAAPVTAAAVGRGAPSVGQMAALAGYARQCAARLPGEPTALDYLRERFAVDADLAARLGLGVDPGGAWYSGPLTFGATYTAVPRLTIPFLDFQGRTAGLQGRALVDCRLRWSGPVNPDETTSWSKVAVFDLATGLDSIVITEGPGDALTAVAGGFDAVAIRGAGLAQNLDLQRELAAYLQGRRVVLAGDRDDAGAKFNADLRHALEAAGVAVYVMGWDSAPEEAKDLTAWRMMAPTTFAMAFHDAVEGAGSNTRTVQAPAVQRTTDVGMARTLRERFMVAGDDGVRYAEGLGFFLWNGSVWVADRRGMAVRREAQDMALEMEAVGKEALREAGGDANLEAAARAQIKAALRAQGSTVLDGILKELAPMVMVELEQMDAHAHLLACRNGVIDLRRGTLAPHDRRLLLTRMVDVDYDPAAVAPRWDAFLSEVFPGLPGLPAYVQRIVGYGVSGETSEQCFAILHGQGSNGKSIFTDTLTHVFRAVTTTTPFSTFEARTGGGGIPNDVAALRGARLVMASEGEQGKYMAEAVIKRVTGQDLISARFMREEFFEFRPTFLIFLATNHKPRFKGQDEGLWRRVKLIPWARYFAPHERDHYLSRDLRAEAPGILAWAVRGAVEWYAKGLQDPPEVTDSTRGYRENSDPLAGFVGSFLVKEPGAKVPAPDVYEAYKHWAEEVEGMRLSDIWTVRTFYEALEERGFFRKKARLGNKVGMLLLDTRLVAEADVARGLDVHTEDETLPPVGRPR